LTRDTVSGVDPIAETRFGKIRGTREDGLCVFRGVPYAEPPVGSRRFRAPQPPTPWPGVRDTRSFGAPAPQTPGMLARLLGSDTGLATENCLSLNLWTPALDQGKRPVMVWIHGGSFTSGTAGSPIYDGSFLVRRGDVVVVTFNYRLGALGFLALPCFEEEEGVFGNLGLLDQITVLEWVKEHVSRFGGDPECVTVFGESAGAMSAGALLATPRARGFLRRAVLQSGAAENVSSREEAARVSACFLEELGLGRPDAERLRSVPVTDLLAAQQRTVARMWRSVSGLTFQPVVDGRVIPAPPLERIRSGCAAGVSLLVGSNRDEYKLWNLADPKARELDQPALLRRCQRNIPGQRDDGTSHAARAIETYTKARRGRASVEPSELWIAIETDRLIRVPALRLAEFQRRHQRQTYAYLFTWTSPAMEGALGSCHALEIAFVFGTLHHPGISAFVGAGPAAERLSLVIQEAWLAFARTGDPSHPQLGDWLPYHPEGRPTQLLGPECELVNAPFEEERRFWDDLPDLPLREPPETARAEHSPRGERL
jgi:para-nitrobenzyl esterase